MCLHKTVAYAITCGYFIFMENLCFICFFSSTIHLPSSFCEVNIYVQGLFFVYCCCCSFYWMLLILVSLCVGTYLRTANIREDYSHRDSMSIYKNMFLFSYFVFKNRQIIYRSIASPINGISVSFIHLLA